MICSRRKDFGSPNDLQTNTGWYVALPRQLGLPRYHDMPWRTNASLDPGRSIWIVRATRAGATARISSTTASMRNMMARAPKDQQTRSLDSPSTTVVWLFDSKNLPATGDWRLSTQTFTARAHSLRSWTATRRVSAAPSIGTSSSIGAAPTP